MHKIDIWCTTSSSEVAASAYCNKQTIIIDTAATTATRRKTKRKKNDEKASLQSGVHFKKKKMWIPRDMCCLHVPREIVSLYPTRWSGSQLVTCAHTNHAAPQNALGAAAARDSFAQNFIWWLLVMIMFLLWVRPMRAVTDDQRIVAFARLDNLKVFWRRILKFWRRTTSISFNWVFLDNFFLSVSPEVEKQSRGYQFLAIRNFRMNSMNTKLKVFLLEKVSIWKMRLLMNN